MNVPASDNTVELDMDAMKAMIANLKLQLETERREGEEQRRQRVLNETLKSTKDFLVNHQLLTREIDNFVAPATGVYAIEGEIQSGKTKTMLGYMMLNNSTGIKTIAVVRNITEDCIQMRGASMQMNNAYGKYCHDADIHKTLHQSAALDVDDIKTWALNPCCNSLIIMANAAQLKVALECAREHNIRFALFVDEADQLLHTTPSKDANENVSFLMQELVDMSQVQYFVSATNYANYFTKDIRVDHIIHVPRNPKYKGVDSLKFTVVHDTNKPDNHDFRLSPRLFDVLDVLTLRDIYTYQDEKTGEQVEHPTIVLAKYSNWTAHHGQLVQHISTEPKYNEKWIALSYNGDGVTIYSPTLINATAAEVTFARIDATPSGGIPGTFHFKDMSIKQALSYLNTSGATKQIPRVVIAAGLMAGRCINFMDSTYTLHITDEFLDPAVTATTDSMIQSLRICGNHQVDTPLNVWCSETTRDNIVRTYNTFNTFIANLKKDEYANETVQSILQKTVIHRSKLGKNKICKVSKPYRVTAQLNADNMNTYSDMAAKTTKSTPAPSTSTEEKKKKQPKKTEEKKMEIRSLERYKNTANYQKLVDSLANQVGKNNKGRWVHVSTLGKDCDQIVNVLWASAKNDAGVAEETPGLLINRVGRVYSIRIN